MVGKMQDKKTAALCATLELISEQGFHATPMSQIAERANIGVGTIYRYFPSKEDLINSLYIDIKTRFAQMAFKNFSETMPIRESYLLFLRSFFDYYIENPKEFLFMEQYANSPMITDGTRQETMRMFDRLRNLFDRAREENLLKDLPMAIINAITNGSTLALVKLYIFSEPKPDDATINAGLEAIWDAIKR